MAVVSEFYLVNGNVLDVKEGVFHPASVKVSGGVIAAPCSSGMGRNFPGSHE